MSLFPENRALTRKELAAAYGCCTWTISMAKRAGFVMPFRRATLAEFRDWLRENPHFIASRFARIR